MRLHICSLKSLYMRLDSGEINADCPAVICSSNVIDRDKLGKLNLISTVFNADGLLREAQAHEIAEFIKKNVDSADEFIFCCDSGETVSVAIAAAFYRYIGKSDRIFWHDWHYRPDRNVFSLMCSEFGIKTSDSSIKLRKRANERAFNRALRYYNHFHKTPYDKRFI